MNQTSISVPSLKEMTHQQREELLKGIRERRLQPIRVYEQLTLMKAEARREGLESTLNKTLEMFAKELERVDKAFEKLEARVRKLRIIELELEQL